MKKLFLILVLSLASLTAQAGMGAISYMGQPAGQVIVFAGASCPPGYLTMPTAAANISRTTYAALFAAIGTAWGAGDGVTTFGQPWLAVNYTFVQGSIIVGTATVGQVIAHAHNSQGIQSGGFGTVAPVMGAGGGAGWSYATTTTGGAANLAAGVYMTMCVKT